MTSKIPARAQIEKDLPVEELFELCIREGNHKRPVYQMHKWWARRLGSAFRLFLLASTMPAAQSTKKLWRRFYSANDLSDLTILDPFMGGGTSIVEATKCRARTIGIDIDPVAWFITRKEIEPCRISSLEETYFRIGLQVEERIKGYYKTRTPEGELADVIYCFWVDVIPCPECGQEFEAHPNHLLGYDKPTRKLYAFCSECHTIRTASPTGNWFRCRECKSVTRLRTGSVHMGRYKCPHCRHRGRVVDVAGPEGPLKKRLFAVEYELADKKGRAYKKADSEDLAMYTSAEREFLRLSRRLRFPRSKIPTQSRHDHRPASHGYTHYWKLFNSRQLLCLSLILEKIGKIRNAMDREYLFIAFSDALASNNLLCSYAYGYRKLTPLFGLHAYNVVNRPVENNVWGTTYGRGSFSKCVAKVIAGKRNCEAPFEMKYPNGRVQSIKTGERIEARVTRSPSAFAASKASALLLNRSSETLSPLRHNSVDLILTDPPYFDTLSYSELSDFYYVWLRKFLVHGESWRSKSTPCAHALFVPGNDLAATRRFAKGLASTFAECSRVLKHNGLMVFTFHHRKPIAWAVLHAALASTDLVATNVLPVRSEGKSGFHSSEGTIKWDAVLACRHGIRRETSLCDDELWKWVDRRLSLWEGRLKARRYGFSWSDRMSLGYALAVKRMSEHSLTGDEARVVLETMRQRLARRVPRGKRHLTSRDNRMSLEHTDLL
jgi:adenine-specific DNA methylase